MLQSACSYLNIKTGNRWKPLVRLWPTLTSLNHRMYTVGVSLRLGVDFSHHSTPLLLPACCYFVRASLLHPGLSTTRDDCNSQAIYSTDTSRVGDKILHIIKIPPPQIKWVSGLSHFYLKKKNFVYCFKWVYPKFLFIY